MTGKFESEAQLAETVKRKLDGAGWTAYAEVQVGQGEQRADLVFQAGRRIMIIETKLSLSIDVVSQTCRWVGKAHYIVIAVPAPKSHSSERIAFIVDYLRQRGIGLWWITPGEIFLDASDREYDRARLSVVVKERLHRWADWKAQKLRGVLVEEMTSAVAGAKTGGVASTPFKRTCLALFKFVEKFPGTPFVVALENIQHHYSSIASARSAIELIAKTAGVEIRDGLLFAPGVTDVSSQHVQHRVSRPESKRRHNDTAVIHCSECHGTLGQVKYDPFGMDFIRALRPKLDRAEAYVEWESSINLPPYQACGCNGCHRQLI